MTRPSVSQDFDKLISRSVESGGRVSFGLEGFDRLVGGVQPGRLVAVVGAPGSAKTSLLAHLARSVASPGCRVVVISSELPSPVIFSKMVAGFCGIGLVEGKIPAGARDEHRPELELFRRTVAPNLYLVEDRIEARRIHEIVSEIREGLPTGDMAPQVVVFVDYLQILPVEFAHADERSAIWETTVELRHLASAHNVMVVAAASMNRTSYDKPLAGLDSIAGFSGIEYSCDTVLHLRIAGKSSKEQATNMRLGKWPMVLSTVKSRYSLPGSSSLLFDAARSSFEDAAEDAPTD